VTEAPPEGDEEEPSESKAPQKKASSKEPPRPDIDVKTVRLSGGEIYYTDKFIRPHVDATLTDLEGAITGLTSDEAKQADVLIKGKVGGHAPLEIKGKINPLGRDLYLDLLIKTKGIDLSPATPYAGKYMGYTIAKGKLSLDLKYFVADRKITAENKVLLDQFTLGETVDSPDATNLPVSLAVSLLKNRAGEIKLDLPISGSLDDPEFKVGGVILQMVVNILEKVLTAPFALLGAIAGGGEELSYLEFEPGLSSIDQKGREKLGTLVEVLHDRPGLKIELEGHADLEADKAVLEEKAFMRKLKKQKLKEMLARGETRVPLDEITLSPDEYRIYLTRTYQAEKGPEPKPKPQDKEKGQPKDGPDAVKEPTPEEMKEMLMTGILVTDDRMRLLALERAEATRDFMVGSGKVEAKRVFLSEPSSLAPEKKKNLKDSRVNFTLK